MAQGRARWGLGALAAVVLVVAAGFVLFADRVPPD